MIHGVSQTHWGGGSFPGLVVVLGYIRRQAEQAMESKPVSSTPLWPLDQLLTPGSSPACVPVLSPMMNYNLEV